MIKKIAWDAFKNTGDINTFLEYKEIENYLYTLELQNGYIQELGEHEEEYSRKPYQQ